MVLSGTVQRDKDRLRVTARLVNTADGFTVWSDMFERESKDVFKVQDEISSAIVAAISPELTSSATRRPPRAAPPATAAASTATTARPISRRTISICAAATSSTSAARRACAARSTTSSRPRRKTRRFARAYAGIANVYALLPLYANVRVDSVMPLAIKAINRAVALDSTLPEAFASRGSLLQAGWRWADAEADYKRALALDPNYATAHQWYGELLLLNGRARRSAHPAQARHRARSAVADHVRIVRARARGGARRSDTAVIAGKRAVELDSSLVVTRFMLGTVYLESAQFPTRRAQLEAAAKLDSSSVHDDRVC